MSSQGAAPTTERSATTTGLDVDRDIDLVLAFLNTCNTEHRTDVLSDLAEWRRWCAEHGLGSPPDITAAREPRDILRRSVMCRAAPEAGVSAAWPMRIELDGGAPVLAGTDALGTVLASAVHLVHTGHWERFKICPAEDCLWAFYDRSRNRSRTWCSMRVCGNREKARGWRERHTHKSA